MGIYELNIILKNRITSEELPFRFVRCLSLSRFMSVSSGRYINSVKLEFENGRVFHYPSSEWFVCYADKHEI